MIAILATALLLVAPPLVEQPPLVDLSTGATVEAPAERVDPPPPPPVEELPAPKPAPPAPAPAVFSSASSNGRCVGAEGLLAAYSPGWSVERMSRIMYRESRCQPGVRNPSGATGLLQIMPMHCSWIDGCTVARLQQPEFNIKAAAALWRRQGYGAWSL